MNKGSGESTRTGGQCDRMCVGTQLAAASTIRENAQEIPGFFITFYSPPTPTFTLSPSTVAQPSS